MSSDEIVKSLQPFGIVKIFQSDDKSFSAKSYLFMHGMKAEVHSGYGHATMLVALQELQWRVFKVVDVGNELSPQLPTRETIR